MPTNVNNLEFLDSALSELSQTQVEKRIIEFLSSGLSEIDPTTIKLFASNFEFLGGLGTPVAPVVANVTPAGGTAIQLGTVISFDVTDPDSGLFRELIVIASFPGLGLLEIIHMDAAFGPQYAQLSTRTPITNGFHYNVLRNNGWPGSPTIIIKAIDLVGAENV